ncbi:MAG TPA: DUF2934 domain-containing protein [Steroidobacteraceae bacterium]
MSDTRIQGLSAENKPSRKAKRSIKKTVPVGKAEPDRASETTSVVAVSLSAVDRDDMIATAAYFRAQKRNFETGHELEDWLAAEAEIDAALLQGLQA